MKNVIVQAGQTWLDIAEQYCGDSDRAIEIAILNGYDDMTGDIIAGQIVKVPTDLLAINKKVTSVFTSKNAPASALSTFDNYEDEWQQYYSTGLPSSHE